MVNARGCTCYTLRFGGATHKKYTDTFIFLNAVRVLSIISLMLLFSSTIVTMVEDIKAVNAFVLAERSDVSASNSTSSSSQIDCSVYDCDYIEYVLSRIPRSPFL